MTEVFRSSTGSGGPHAFLDFTEGTSYTDSDVTRNTTYWYYVHAFDAAGNRSGPSNQIGVRLA